MAAAGGGTLLAGKSIGGTIEEVRWIGIILRAAFGAVIIHLLAAISAVQKAGQRIRFPQRVNALGYHIELLEKPTIYLDFHSLLLGIQMMFSFMLVDDAKPLRLCKHCQKVFLGSRANSAFCSAQCKNQYNVYKTRAKSREDKENG